MNVADKLRYLNQTKRLIKQAIIDKGVDVSSIEPFRNYPNKINEIITGGADNIIIPAGLAYPDRESALSVPLIIAEQQEEE